MAKFVRYARRRVATLSHSEQLVHAANIPTSRRYRLGTSGAFCLCRGQRHCNKQRVEKEGALLWTIAVILLVLWALGMFTAYTAGGLVHLLLVIAVIVVVFQFIGGRRSV